jgi:hypothetical protein
LGIWRLKKAMSVRLWKSAIHFVIAVLTAVREDDHTPIRRYQRRVEAEVRKEKKAEQFIKELAAC